MMKRKCIYGTVKWKIENRNKRFQMVVEAILESRSMIHDERTTVHVTFSYQSPTKMVNVRIWFSIFKTDFLYWLQNLASAVPHILYEFIFIFIFMNLKITNFNLWPGSPFSNYAGIKSIIYNDWFLWKHASIKNKN